MYRLLIVDDEKHIRDGIKRMIPWEEYGIEICGEASNGKLALALMNQYQPHILITDIKMPEMDGLELLKKIRQRNLKIRTIVLSGYDEFQYVRQAMKYGAIDYILKPSGKSDIIQIVEEIINNLEDEINAHIENQNGFELLKSNVLNRLFKNEISPMELREKLQMLKIDLTKVPLAVAVIEIIKNKQDEKLESEEYINKTFEINKVCQQWVEEREEGIVFINSEGNVSLILENMNENDVKLGKVDALKELRRRIIGEVKCPISIAVGDCAQSHRSLRLSYTHAMETKEYQFVFGRDSILYYEEIKNYFNEKKSIIDVDNQQVITMIENEDYSGIEKYVVTMFDKYICEERIPDCFVLRNCALEILIVSFHCIEKLPLVDKKKILSMKQEALSKISTEFSYEEMQNSILESIQKILDEMKVTSENKYTKQVWSTIKMIQNNYSDPDLSLQYLADEFHINTAYLGRVFKKETGSTFTDYLSMIRIEKAKDLVMNTNYKGTEICKKVGFTNYNYFYIVFKKITGQTPVNFRK